MDVTVVLRQIKVALEVKSTTLYQMIQLLQYFTDQYALLGLFPGLRTQAKRIFFTGIEYSKIF